MATATAVPELPPPRAAPVRALSAFRHGLVARPRLVARLADPSAPPLALVAAPAGYGKTTVLAEWVAREARPVEWIALSPEHDDAALLAAALERVLEREDRFVLVLDDVHVLRSRGALKVLQTLVEGFPVGSRLALGSRTEPALPIARLRAHRALTELRTRDLAMNDAEATALFDAEGLALRPRERETLVRRTEGWPAGLYLAAVSLREEDDAGAAVERFGGHDAAVRQYLGDVVLAGLPRSAVSFLLRTSVLDRLYGPLCDAVLRGRGAGRVLDRLAQDGLLLVPLDRRGEWYRLPRLLAEMLAAELRRCDPTGEAELRRRASEWYSAEGDSERAIPHAIAAGAGMRASELLWAAAPECIAKGRNDTVRRWLGGLADDVIAADPRLALVAAGSELARGNLGAAERWESAARRMLHESGPGPQANAVGAVATIVRAAPARDGLARMAGDARRAGELAPEDSPWRSICLLLEGVALHLTGDPGAAEPLLEEGARRGAVAAPNIQALCLAQLALMAAERDDWEGAAAFSTRGRTQIDHYGLGGYPTEALVFAASAVVQARRGRVDEARDDLRHALRLLGELVDFAPWYEAEARVALARAALKLGDLPAARELLAAASRAARRAPDATLLHDWVADTRAQADAVSAAALAGSSSLTTAELRILRFLPTHLSFREIAARLYVSANTVKTQAHAVYRKLDASSRSQAVARASQLGLLDV